MAISDDQILFLKLEKEENYSVNLESSLILTQKYDYEIGIIKAIIPPPQTRVYQSWIRYYSPTKNQIVQHDVHYAENESPDVFIAYLNSIIQEKNHYRFGYNSVRHVFTLELITDGQIEPFLQISEDLRKYTSLPETTYERQGAWISTNFPQISGSNDIIHVFCNAIKASVFQDSNDRIMQTICLPTSADKPAYHTYEAKNILYFQTEQKIIKQMGFSFKNGNMQDYPFSDHVYIILHLRPSLNYL